MDKRMWEYAEAAIRANSNRRVNGERDQTHHHKQNEVCETVSHHLNLFYFIHITGHSPIVTTEMKKSGVIHAAQPFIRATSFIHTKAYSMKFKLYHTSRIPAAYRNCIPSIWFSQNKKRPHILSDQQLIEYKAMLSFILKSLLHSSRKLQHFDFAFLQAYFSSNPSCTRNSCATSAGSRFFTSTS